MCHSACDEISDGISTILTLSGLEFCFVFCCFVLFSISWLFYFMLVGFGLFVLSTQLFRRYWREIIPLHGQTVIGQGRRV